MTLSLETFAKALRAARPEIGLAAALEFAGEAFEAHPKIRTPDAAAFALAVQQRLGSKPLGQLRPADLFLAQGAAAGDPAALSTFTQLCRQRIPRVLASMRPPAALVEEVGERLEEKLLISVRGKPPRLAEYQGSGSLAAWVGVAAVRIAIELSRLKRYHSASAMEEGSAAGGIAIGDPEVELLQSSHSTRFKEAFESAFTRLSLEDRNLLRMHLKDGMSIDQLGLMFRIHRATAARRIAKAKELVLEGIRAVLSTKYRMSLAEIDSDLRSVAPNLDLSLSRLLIAVDRPT